MIFEIVLAICLTFVLFVRSWEIMKSQDSGPGWKFADTQVRSNRIHAAATRLLEWDGSERELHSTCRETMKDILENCAFLMYVVDRSGLHEPQEAANSRESQIEQRKTVFLEQIAHLRCRVAMVHVQFLFRTAGERHRRFILWAAYEHGRIWIAYFRLLIHQFPDQYGSIVLSDEDEVEISEPHFEELISRRAG